MLLIPLVEEVWVWPEGLLDSYFAMSPKVDGDATPLGQRPLLRASCGVSYLGICSYDAVGGLVGPRVGV